jgi:septum formation protein
VAAGHTRPKLILASASPRRLDLLRQIAIDPDQVTPTEVDETPIIGELAGPLAQRLAIAKASAVSATGAVVLGADTVVACGRRILPKARNAAEARRTLQLLSGRRHTVYTGIAVIDALGQLRQRLVKTAVAFKRLDERELGGYLNSGEWQGKAGAYGIQGRAATFVRFINGSYSNVVGLPLYETAALLSAAGYPVAESACDAPLVEGALS